MNENVYLRNTHTFGIPDLPLNERRGFKVERDGGVSATIHEIREMFAPKRPLQELQLRFIKGLTNEIGQFEFIEMLKGKLNLPKFAGQERELKDSFVAKANASIKLISQFVQFSEEMGKFAAKLQDVVPRSEYEVALQDAFFDEYETLLTAVDKAITKLDQLEGKLLKDPELHVLQARIHFDELPGVA